MKCELLLLFLKTEACNILWQGINAVRDVLVNMFDFILSQLSDKNILWVS